MRLNLGCGNKILPGYVNVDAVPYRDHTGKQKDPDHIMDICKLTFEDNVADEILTVHVVEHFYPWDIQNVLKEWIRVLKPGGLMAIEVPNILYAAQELVKQGEIFNDKHSDMLMHLWYGDPVYGDPLMHHKWGYTPKTLLKLVNDVGLKGCKPVPAKYKRGWPRDIRVEGRK